jgi:5'-AMP-activated protein kinase regulatory beta subunit
MERKKAQQVQSFALKAPTANSVLLAGDFTHWQRRAIPMKKQPGGFWMVNVLLQPGTYHYRFVVDDQWCDDPACTLRVSNPYGSQDAVRQVA